MRTRLTLPAIASTLAVILMSATAVGNVQAHGTEWVITKTARSLGITKYPLDLTPSDIDKLTDKQAYGLAKIERELWGRGSGILESIKAKDSRTWLKRANAKMALVSLASPAKADIDSFFCGVHLGMSIDDCAAYYARVAGSGPIFWGGAPPGQKTVDFRNRTVSQPDDIIRERRVVVTYRVSDGKIVSIGYWDLTGDQFSKDDLKKLLDLNRGRGLGHLVSHLYDDEEFVVTTAQQYRLEQENARALKRKALVP